MSSFGFIKLPRSLLESTAWRGAKLKYRAFFIELMMRVCWKKQEISWNGHVIELGVGQYAKSYREIIKEFNPEGLNGRAKSDTFSKNDIEGSVKFFLKHGLVRQEIRHDLMILTVLLPDIFEQEKPVDQTADKTAIRQRSDTNKEREEEQERKEASLLKERAPAPASPSPARGGVFFCRKTKRFVGLDELMPELRSLHTHLQRIPEHIERAARWLMTNEKGKTRIGNKAFINNWLRNASDSEIKTIEKTVFSQIPHISELTDLIDYHEETRKKLQAMVL